jgi:hypothetical protein
MSFYHSGHRFSFAFASLATASTMPPGKADNVGP